MAARAKEELHTWGVRSEKKKCRRKRETSTERFKTAEKQTKSKLEI